MGILTTRRPTASLKLTRAFWDTDSPLLSTVELSQHIPVRKMPWRKRERSRETGGRLTRDRLLRLVHSQNLANEKEIREQCAEMDGCVQIVD